MRSIFHSKILRNSCQRKSIFHGKTVEYYKMYVRFVIRAQIIPEIKFVKNLKIYWNHSSERLHEFLATVLNVHKNQEPDLCFIGFSTFSHNSYNYSFFLFFFFLDIAFLFKLSRHTAKILREYQSRKNNKKNGKRKIVFLEIGSGAWSV